MSNNLQNMKLGIGVVEDRNDPKKLNRVRVRIFQLHDDDRNKQPTSSLPWAQTVLPTNGSRMNSLPKEGEWVVCSFIDGPNGQEPLVFGTLTGIAAQNMKTPSNSDTYINQLKAQLKIEKTQLEQLYKDFGDASNVQAYGQQVKELGDAYRQAESDPNVSAATKQKMLDAYNQAVTRYESASAAAAKGVTMDLVVKQEKIVKNLEALITDLEIKNNRTPTTGFQDVGSQKEVNQRPVPPGYSKDNKKGEPTSPRLTRGFKAGTGIEWVDSALEHVCDVSIYVQRAVAYARTWATEVGLAIRKGLQAIIKFLGIQPASNGFIQKVKKLAALVRKATKFIKRINDGILKFLKYVKIIRGVIEYILSLPAKILAIFRKCLTEALKELMKLPFELLAGVKEGAGGLGADSGFAELGKELKGLATDIKAFAKETTTLLSAPSQFISAITSPSGMSEAEKQEWFTKLQDPTEREKIAQDIFPDSTKHDSNSYQRP